MVRSRNIGEGFVKSARVFAFARRIAWYLGAFVLAEGIFVGTFGRRDLTVPDLALVLILAVFAIFVALAFRFLFQALKSQEELVVCEDALVYRLPLRQRKYLEWSRIRNVTVKRTSQGEILSIRLRPYGLSGLQLEWFDDMEGLLSTIREHGLQDITFSEGSGIEFDSHLALVSMWFVSFVCFNSLFYLLLLV